MEYNLCIIMMVNTLTDKPERVFVCVCVLICWQLFIHQMRELLLPTRLRPRLRRLYP